MNNRGFNLTVQQNGSVEAVRVAGTICGMVDCRVTSTGDGINVTTGRLIASVLYVGADGAGIILGDDYSVVGDSVVLAGGHGIHITGNGNLVHGVSLPVVGVTAGDGIRIDGDQNTVMDCDITGDGTTNSAINVQGDDNVFVPNVARGTYATAAFIDGGTGNVNTFPNAGGAQGDNIVI